MTNAAARILRRIPNPFAHFFGPIFGLEMAVAGRRARTYWLRFASVFSLLVIVGLAFLSMRMEVSPGGAASVEQLQTFAPVLATVILWTQFIAVALLAPLMCSTAISEERRAGTLYGLLSAPLTATQIIVGKFTARLALLLVIGLSTLPLLLAIRVFGGLDTRFVIGAYALTASVAVLGGIASVLYSVRAKRSVGAAVLAIITVPVIQGAPMLLWGAIDGFDNAPPTWIICTCTPAVFVFLQLGDMPLPAAGLSVEGALILALAINLGWSLLLLAVTILRFRGVMQKEVDGAPQRKNSKRRKKEVRAEQDAVPQSETAGSAPSVQPAAALRSADAKASKAKAHASRVVSDHPVLWRELRLPLLAGGRNRMALYTILIAALGVYYLWVYRISEYTFSLAFSEQGYNIVPTIIPLLLALLVSGFLTTSAITGERESRTLDVLMTSPLTPRQIVLGKYFGSLRRQWLAPAFILAHCSLLFLLGWLHPVGIFIILLTTLGPVALFTATGLMYSVVLARTTTAAVLNLLTILGLYAGVPLAMVVADIITQLDFDLLESLEFVFYSNPLVTMTISLDGFLSYGDEWGGLAMYEMEFGMNSGMGLIAWALLTLGVFVGYTGTAALVLWFTTRNLRGLLAKR